MSLPDRIPVYFLSGFLGSGKSTLLNDLLSDPAFHDSAVIINEFGDVPVDHLLVRHGETTISQVSTGCLCCSGTTDIRTTLFDLRSMASLGLAPGFSRVIVEMSGLGDPAPLINALTANQTTTKPWQDEIVDGTFYLAGFVTLYDCMSGTSSVQNHFETVKQLAFADRIVLTKTDLVPDPEAQANVAALPSELRSLNASAEIVDRQGLDLSALFSPRPYSVIDRGEDVTGWLALEAALAMEPVHDVQSETADQTSRHGSGIRTFSIIRDTPLPEKRVQQFLSILRSSAGQRLLRVKGIIATEEATERPLIVHAVQHVLSDPVRLDAWPDDDRRTRIVFITSGIDPEPVRRLFAAAINAAPVSFASVIKRLGGALVSSFSKRLNT